MWQLEAQGGVRQTEAAEAAVRWQRCVPLVAACACVLCVAGDSQIVSLSKRLHLWFVLYADSDDTLQTEVRWKPSRASEQRDPMEC